MSVTHSQTMATTTTTSLKSHVQRKDSDKILPPKPRIRRMCALRRIEYVCRHWHRLSASESAFEKSGAIMRSDIAGTVAGFTHYVTYPRQNHVVKGHSDWIFASVVSDDGLFLYTGSADKSIVCWDLSRSRKIEEWRAHDAGVRCLAMHSDRLISGSYDRSIKVWDMAAASLNLTMTGHEGTILSLDVEKQGRWLVSGSQDKSVRVWNMINGECLSIIHSHSRQVSGTAFIQGSTVVSAAEDGFLQISQPLNIERRVRRIHSQKPVLGLTLNCNRTRLGCLFQGSVLICGLPRMNIQHQISKVVPCLAEFHPRNPHVLAVACNNGSVRLIHLEGKHYRCLRCFVGHTSVVLDLCFSPDGRKLVSVSAHHCICIWDLR